MKPKKKFQWTQELVDILLESNRRAQLQKQQDDPTPVIDLVYNDWVSVTGIQSISKGALKIKLSKLKNSSDQSNSDEKNKSETKSVDNKKKAPVRKNIKKKEKAKTSKQDFTVAMKNTMNECFRDQSKNSPRTIKELLRNTKQAFEEIFPNSTISPLSIQRMLKNESFYKDIVGKIDSQNNIENTNVPDKTKKLQQFKMASEKIGSGPIYKYVCYNCGRMLCKSVNSAGIYKIDPEKFSLKTPPVLTLCEDIGELIYWDDKGKWISCKNCKNGPKEL